MLTEGQLTKVNIISNERNQHYLPPDIWERAHNYHLYGILHEVQNLCIMRKHQADLLGAVYKICLKCQSHERHEQTKELFQFKSTQK